MRRGFSASHRAGNILIGPDANRASGASSWNALRPKRYGRHAESRLNYYRYNSISDGWTSTRFGAHRVFMTVTLCYKKSIRLQQTWSSFELPTLVGPARTCASISLCYHVEYRRCHCLRALAVSALQTVILILCEHLRSEDRSREQ